MRTLTYSDVDAPDGSVVDTQYGLFTKGEPRTVIEPGAAPEPGSLSPEEYALLLSEEGYEALKFHPHFTPSENVGEPPKPTQPSSAPPVPRLLTAEQIEAEEQAAADPQSAEASQARVEREAAEKAAADAAARAAAERVAAEQAAAEEAARAAAEAAGASGESTTTTSRPRGSKG